MKISIGNFKSIGFLEDYEIKPLTILSGNNSSGKSSFIQLLLLIKQTLELNSTNFCLYFDGEYYSAQEYSDLVKKGVQSNKLSISLQIEKSEFKEYGSRVTSSIFDNFNDYKCTLSFVFNSIDDKIWVEDFLVNYESEGGENFIKIFYTPVDKQKNSIDSNNLYFVKELYNEEETKVEKIEFTAMFPAYYERVVKEEVENPQGGTPLENFSRVKEFINLGSIKSFTEVFFKDLYYIGPLRIEPQDVYLKVKQIDSVGTKGERVAQILEEYQVRPVDVKLPNYQEADLTFEQKRMSLIEATNYWMCDIFKFAKQIQVKKIADTYSILFENNNGTIATIKHVGFGISQILPIIVQGLLMESGQTMVLEQPEIHLHPKAQSLLFDFIYSLILQNKKIIIETHSDHFITRLRRRVAEDNDSLLKELTNLTFIELHDKDIVFRTLDLDEYGSLDYYPEDFIERSDIELRAFVKAQMRKRIQNQ